MWLPLAYPLLGTWPTTQACALTGNQTSDPLLHRPVLNPLSHTSQGHFVIFLILAIWLLKTSHFFLLFVYLIINTFEYLFRTSHSYRKANGKQLGCALNLGGWGFQWITRVGLTVSSRLMETQIWRCPAGSVVGGLRKGPMASTSTSVWEKAVPQLLTWYQTIQFLPYVSGSFWAVAPVLEHRTSPTKCMYDPLRGIPGTPGALCLT